MVVDTSALLAVIFDEEHGAWAAEQLKRNALVLCMSTVNLTETLILLRDRQPKLFPRMEKDVLSSGIRFVAPDVSQCRIASDARLRFPLNLGDCFAYALARAEKKPILTLDDDFRNLDCGLLMPKG